MPSKPAKTSPERHVKVFKNGRNKAVRIPRKLEFPGEDAIMRKSHKARVAPYPRANPPKPIRHPERTQVREGSRAHNLSAGCPILSAFLSERVGDETLNQQRRSSTRSVKVGQPDRRCGVALRSREERLAAALIPVRRGARGAGSPTLRDSGGRDLRIAAYPSGEAGTPIGANDLLNNDMLKNDLLIAAQALALGYVIVTDNEREFSRVKGLRLQNWLRSRE